MRGRKRCSRCTIASWRAGEARQNLSPLIEQANDDHAPVHITSRKGNPVLMSEEDFSAWTETVHLLRSPKNARRLLDSSRSTTCTDSCKGQPTMSWIIVQARYHY
ncbi:type II toxin-antitoxin system Phd/YefM family antitoxin [Streptomyces sp. NPDC048362]|uniref:type II toxin-antitoxin system Phd/YefM family antitoxin n=1 Tax=Streptomyces sp. NPDC048362 TaxID=3365539 RepID=UPI003720E0AA